MSAKMASRAPVPLAAHPTMAVRVAMMRIRAAAAVAEARKAGESWLRAASAAVAAPPADGWPMSGLQVAVVTPSGQTERVDVADPLDVFRQALWLAVPKRKVSRPKRPSPLPPGPGHFPHRSPSHPCTECMCLQKSYSRKRMRLMERTKAPVNKQHFYPCPNCDEGWLKLRHHLCVCAMKK